MNMSIFGYSKSTNKVSSTIQQNNCPAPFLNAKTTFFQFAVPYQKSWVKTKLINQAQTKITLSMNPTIPQGSKPKQFSHKPKTTKQQKDPQSKIPKNFEQFKKLQVNQVRHFMAKRFLRTQCAKYAQKYTLQYYKKYVQYQIMLGQMQEKPYWCITNVNYTFKLVHESGNNLNLGYLAEKLQTRFNPKWKLKCIRLYRKRPNCTIQLFSNGKANLKGCQQQTNPQVIINKLICQIHARTGHLLSLKYCQMANVSSTGNIGFKISFDKLQLSNYSSYNLKHPKGMTYKHPALNTTATVYESGNVNLTGTNDPQVHQAQFQILKIFLNDYQV